MQSGALESLSPKVRRSLAKLGTDIATARRKRNLTVVMMAERIGVAKSTYLKVEKGDPSVSMGVYAMALFVLGQGGALGDIVTRVATTLACCSMRNDCRSAFGRRGRQLRYEADHPDCAGGKRPEPRYASV